MTDWDSYLGGGGSFLFCFVPGPAV